MFITLLTIALVILLLISAEIDGGGPFLFLTSLSVYLLAGGLWDNVWSFTTENILKVIIGVISYVAVGTIWSFFKWFKFVKNHVKNNGISYKYAYSPSYNSAKIATWIFCWPTSVIIYFIGDFLYNFIKNATDFIINRFKQVYEKITNYAINSIKKDS